MRNGIKTENRAPIKQPLRRIPVNMREEVDKHIDDMLKRDVIEPSVSPWSAGVVLAKKKDGTTRVGRKLLRNRLNKVQDLIQDTSWEKGQHKKTSP